MQALHKGTVDSGTYSEQIDLQFLVPCFEPLPSSCSLAFSLKFCRFTWQLLLFGQNVPYGQFLSAQNLVCYQAIIIFCSLDLLNLSPPSSLNQKSRRTKRKRRSKGQRKTKKPLSDHILNLFKEDTYVWNKIISEPIAPYKSVLSFISYNHFSLKQIKMYNTYYDTQCHPHFVPIYSKVPYLDRQIFNMEMEGMRESRRTRERTSKAF